MIISQKWLSSTSDRQLSAMSCQVVKTWSRNEKLTISLWSPCIVDTFRYIKHIHKSKNDWVWLLTEDRRTSSVRRARQWKHRPGFIWRSAMPFLYLSFLSYSSDASTEIKHAMVFLASRLYIKTIASRGSLSLFFDCLIHLNVSINQKTN